MLPTIDFHLDHRWSTLLAHSQESGMGYHLVDLVLADGRTFESVPVFNLEHAYLPKEAGISGQLLISELHLHHESEDG